MFLSKLSIIVILICQNLVLVGPVQEKIKLPSSDREHVNIYSIITFE